MKDNEHTRMHPAHERVWTLLPWYENGSLEQNETAEVEAHLGECLVCRAEIARLGTLATAVAARTEDHACAQAYRRLHARIADAETRRAGGLRGLVAHVRGLIEPVPLAAGAALLVVSSTLVSVIVLNGRDSLSYLDQAFETLGPRQAAHAQLGAPQFRVVLREAPGDAGLDEWLARHRAALVDGPSSIGVLTVEVPLGARSFDAVLGEIRGDAETIFVEPVHVIGTRPDRVR